MGILLPDTYNLKTANQIWDNIETITGAKQEELTKALHERDVRISMLQEIWDHPEVLGHIVGFDDLNEMHGEWIKIIWDDLKPGEDRSIMAHRGSMKTSSITQVGCCRNLVFNPKDRIALFRPDRTGAVVITEVVRSWYRLPAIISLLTEAPLNYDVVEKVAKQTNLKWGFMGDNPQKEGNLDAWGMRGSTGYHYDKLVVCDIVTIDDRTSRAKRETTKAFVREVRTSIRDPWSNVLMEGTPWHMDDVWSEFPPIATYNVYQTGMLTEEQIQAKRDTTTKVDFGCNYELQHLNSEDQIFAKPKYEVFIRTQQPSYMHIDGKYDGDHTGAITLFQKRAEDNKYNGRGWVFEDHVDNHLEEIITLCMSHNVRWCEMETNADKGYVIKELKKLAKERKCRTKFKGYPESMNKDAKIQTWGKKNFANIIWDIDMSESGKWRHGGHAINGFAYINQVIMYMDGEALNDAPDSMASLSRSLLEGGAGALWD